MDIYYATYARQYLENGEWKDTYYTNQAIIVLAACTDEAEEKVKKCLMDVEHGEFRAVLRGKVVKCKGLNAEKGFEGAFRLCPIEK